MFSTHASIEKIGETEDEAFLVLLVHHFYSAQVGINLSICDPLDVF